MEAEWEEGTEWENKLDHVFKSTTARETSIERKVWVGKHSTGREETDVEGKQALWDEERDREEKERDASRHSEADVEKEIRRKWDTR